MTDVTTQDVQVPGFYEVQGRSIIKSKLTKARVFIFPARTWAIMEDTLFRDFSTGAAVILHEMGRTYGGEFGSTMKKGKLDSEHAWGFARNIARDAGWGDVTVEGSGLSLKITVRECVFCTGAGRLGSPSCHFLVGVARGIGEQLYGKNVVARETRCTRAGDEACVIELSRS